MDRLTRAEAAKYIGCSLSKLYLMEKGGLLQGTYYEIGTGKRRKRLYIADKLELWMKQGGEPAALDRKYLKKDNRIYFENAR